MHLRLGLALGLLAVAAFAQADENALGRKLGDFRFDQVVAGADGYFGGDAFLGQPVLYEFWGFR